MKDIMHILLDGAVNERFSFIKALAIERDPDEWQEQQAIIERTFNKLNELDPVLYRDLSEALAGEQASLQEAAYFIGFSDGLRVAKITDRETNLSELIYS